jgi:hypothetical protein
MKNVMSAKVIQNLHLVKNFAKGILTAFFVFWLSHVCSALDLQKYDSCRELFKKMEILPLYSQYIFSLLTYVIKKTNIYSLQIIRFIVFIQDIKLIYIRQLPT